MERETKGPIFGARICDRYHIHPDDWPAMDASERALFRMAYQADVMRVIEDGPPYRNRGPEVDRVLQLAGAEPGEPWCAADWAAMLIDSGVARRNLPENAASVHAWGRWAAEHGRLLERPRRACIGLIYQSATAGHLVAVAGVVGHSVRTIEGNTNDDGSREGYAVLRRVRPIASFAHFVDCSRL